MKSSEMVARLIVAKNGRDVDANIDAVIADLCRIYHGSTGEQLMPLALDCLDGYVERGVDLHPSIKEQQVRLA
jgi:hypothetical protein